MQKQKKEQLLDDIARVTGSAATVVSKFARRTSKDVAIKSKEVSQDIAHRLDFIPREEFDAVIKGLEKRIAKLEGKKPATKKPTAKKPAAKKPAAKKPAAKKPTTKKPAAKKPATTTKAKAVKK